MTPLNTCLLLKLVGKQLFFLCKRNDSKPGDEEGLSLLGPFVQSGDPAFKGCPGHPWSFLPAAGRGGGIL